MSYGLVSKDGRTISLKKIECSADVTDNFGVFTLKQCYYNDEEKVLATNYIFPALESMDIIEFNVKRNNCEKEKFDIGNKQSGVRFEMSTGDLYPREEMVIEITYSNEILTDSERTRIIIPTVIPPRFVSLGEQIALESVVGRSIHTVKLDLTYINSNVTNIVSPTHEIVSIADGDKVNIRFENDSYSDRDIIIDIFRLPQTAPKMFYADNIVSCSFCPDIDVYERQSREYLFMLDKSVSMIGEKLEQAKLALLICLRALQNGDKFNILAFDENIELFSDEFLPLNDDTLKVASKWILSHEPYGKTNLMKPIIEAFKNANNRAVMLITDNNSSGSNDIISYVKNHVGAVFYTFGIDCTVGTFSHNFLAELSTITGGAAHFICPAERIDETIIKKFNIIASPSIDDVEFNFDVPVQDKTPKRIKRIHCGENITIMAKIEDRLPKILTIKGSLKNTRSVIQVDFDKVINGGKSLKHQYEYKLKEKSNQKSNPIGDTTRRNKIDEHFLSLCKSQKASGRFMPKGSKTKENIGLYSAQVLYEFCAECPNVDMYIWHLRKTSGFLLEYIQNSNNAMIPSEIVKALSLWHEVLGGNDEISQKVAVLRFLHRGK